jgi:LPXTG-site transpeptidase (sortase) family protein
VPTATNIDVYVIESATPTPNPAVPDGQIVFSLEYGNDGTDPASNVTIQSVLDANLSFVSATSAGTYNPGNRTITWTVCSGLGCLASRATGTASVTVTIVNPLAANVDSISNTATISTSSTESTISNNSSSANTTVNAQPDLKITKTDGVTQVLAGADLTYTITVQNTGNQDAGAITITDTPLNGIIYQSASPSGTYHSGDGTYTWAFSSLDVGKSEIITISAEVNPNALTSTVAANRVTASDDGTNGADPNLGDNTSTDSDVVIAPYIVLEKDTSALSGNPVGVAYTGQEITYILNWRNTGDATAFNVNITDTLPADTTLVAGSITGDGIASGAVISWNFGTQLAGANGSVSYTVIANPGAGGSLQTVPTLSTESSSGTISVTSSAEPPTLSSQPFCDLDDCAAFRGIYTGTNGAPPTGYNDNPRLTAFDDSGWTQAGASSTSEFSYWTSAETLSAEWVSLHTDSETVGNYTFFRQPFCMPLNATGLSANLNLAGDDASDIYLNGVYLGQQYGAGGANSFPATGIQSGINILAVQLLNNRHGGHPLFSGGDHSGLLFNLSASYTGLRPFVSAPSMIAAGQGVTFSIDENALGGRTPYFYKINFGDGSLPIDYQLGTTFNHTYSTPGSYTATVTTRAQYGCTGTDQMIITVLPPGRSLLSNTAIVGYEDATWNRYNGMSGAGLEMDQSADLSITKSITSGGTIPGLGISYQLLVTNNGPDSLTGVLVSDTIPTAVIGVSWTCVSSGGTCAHATGSGNTLNETVNLQVDATATYFISGTISPDATGSLSNTATVAPPSSVTDLDPLDNSSTVSNNLIPTANLTIAKTINKDPAIPGESLTYSIIVKNQGPSNVVDAILTDTVPDTVNYLSWTCASSDGTCGHASGSGNAINETISLPVNATATYTLSGMVSSDATGIVSNTAVVAAPAGVTDSYPTNNTSTADTTLIPTVDLSITKSSDPNPALPGENLTYTIIVSNAGPSDALNATVSDTFPSILSGLTWTCFTSFGSACTPNGQGNINDSLTLTSGGTATYIATGNLATSSVNLLSNTASVSAAVGTTDSNLENNSATDHDPSQARSWVNAHLFNDQDANGTQSPSEPSLIGWKVELFQGSDCSSTVLQQQLTDTSGAAQFSPLVTAGSYSLSETIQASWVNSASTPICRNLTITLGASPATILFGNYQLKNFGHLPSAFENMNLLAEGGAWAVTGSTYLGETVISASDGINTASYTPKLSDDGIIWTGIWDAGNGHAIVNVTCPDAPCYLYAWADWDNNKDFTGSNEAIYAGVVSNGDNPIDFKFSNSSIPLSSGTYYTRFRVYSQPPLDPQPNGPAQAADGARIVGEIEDPPLVSIGDGSTPNPLTFETGIFDPPTGFKTFDAQGMPLLTWRMVWINSANIVAIDAQVSDPIMAGTTYSPTYAQSGVIVNGSWPAGIPVAPTPPNTILGVSCTTPVGSVSTTEYCYYEGPSLAYPLGRIMWQGHLGPDLGHIDATTAVNYVEITFNVSTPPGTFSAENIASVNADLNGDHDFGEPGEVNSASASSQWGLAAKVLPDTGFAPNRMTVLPAQTVSYADLGELWLEIPRLGVKMPIVGVPAKNGEWDVSWLGNQAGWLNGTAFPTLAGNSVITGHVFDAFGQPGLFEHLNWLWYGDQIIIHAGGAQYLYEVRQVTQVTPDELTSIIHHEELPWVTLITCRGYDEASNSYKYRVAVRAVLIEVK